MDQSTESTLITPMENLRQQMIIAMSSQALVILTTTSNKDTYCADMIQRFVDTFISRHQVNSLIPVHIPHPLSSNILEGISSKSGGRITRTVKVDVEDFYPYENEDREDLINETMIAPGSGTLTNITWKQVGFSRGEVEGKQVTYAYLEVNGTYVPPTAPPKPRGRAAITDEVTAT